MPTDPNPPDPFWKAKRLEDLDAAEWESLCDGCGRCCLVKLEEDDTGETHFTDVACFMLDCRQLPLLRLRGPQEPCAGLRHADA